MSRTKRSKDKFSEGLRSENSFKRQQRRDMLKEFEREYIGHNQNPHIEL